MWGQPCRSPKRGLPLWSTVCDLLALLSAASNPPKSYRHPYPVAIPTLSASRSPPEQSVSVYPVPDLLRLGRSVSPTPFQRPSPRTEPRRRFSPLPPSRTPTTKLTAPLPPPPSLPWHHFSPSWPPFVPRLNHHAAHSLIVARKTLGFTAKPLTFSPELPVSP